MMLNLRKSIYVQLTVYPLCINYLEQNVCLHIKRSISFLNINSEWTDPMFDEVLYRASFPFCGFHNSIFVSGDSNDGNKCWRRNMLVKS